MPKSKEERSEGAVDWLFYDIYPQNSPELHIRFIDFCIQ